MRPGLQFVAVKRFGVFARGSEQSNDSPVQQVVVAAAEQERFVDVQRSASHCMLGGKPRFEIGKKTVLGMAEIDHVFLEVLKFSPVFLRERFCQVGGQVTERKLAFVMVGVIDPLLLYVHFVRVESVERHSGPVVSPNQVF